MLLTSACFEPVPTSIEDSRRSGFIGSDLDIVTCEYPPSLGGVADYTLKVAGRLEQQGYSPTVWVSNKKKDEAAPNSRIKRSFTNFGLRDILVHELLMGNPRGRCLLLQWEPVGFGCKSLNLLFCLWIALRALRGTRLLVMFHETFLPYSKRSLTRYFASTVQRLMAASLANAADTVFVSNESGAAALKQFCLTPEKVRQLAVFSNIEEHVQDPERVAALRTHFASAGEPLVGHFGRFMTNTEPLVLPVVKHLLASNTRMKFLFIGECGAQYRSTILVNNPELEARVFASGVRSSEEIGTLISACDLMFQPYPGGVTTKRSSTMAALALGRCVVSNLGEETERLWQDCAGVQLLGDLQPVSVASELNRLCEAKGELAHRGAAASTYYQKTFSLELTIEALMSSIRPSEPVLVASPV